MELETYSMRRGMVMLQQEVEEGGWKEWKKVCTEK